MMVQSAEDRQRRISLAVSPWPMTGAFGVVVILLVRTQDMAQVSRGCIPIDAGYSVHLQRKLQPLDEAHRDFRGRSEIVMSEINSELPRLL